MIDEQLHLRREKARRWVNERQRDKPRGPRGQNPDELLFHQRLAAFVDREQRDSLACDRSVAKHMKIVHDEPAVHRNRALVVSVAQRPTPAIRACAKYEARVIDELFWGRGWRVLLEIRRARDDEVLHRAQWPRDQARIGQSAGPNGDIEILAHQIDEPIGRHHLELHLVIGREKLSKNRP